MSFSAESVYSCSFFEKARNFNSIILILGSFSTVEKLLFYFFYILSIPVSVFALFFAFLFIFVFDDTIPSCFGLFRSSKIFRFPLKIFSKINWTFLYLTLAIRIAGDIRHVEQVLVPLVVPNHVVVMRLFTADSFQDSLKIIKSWFGMFRYAKIDFLDKFLYLIFMGNSQELSLALGLVE